MAQHPILVLQMQRMGDLVLSFPLVGWLSRHFPQHPIWVVGEETFFRPLMSLSPSVTYFSYSGITDFYGTPFHLVLNLSHRPEAALLAGTVIADEVFGPCMQKDGALRIRGNWQLYRAALTHNNRYNQYHWADMHALDCIPATLMSGTKWPLPRQEVDKSMEDAGRRIGLFIGASEADKRPDADFWVSVTRQLIRLGFKPVLLGGKAELPLGNDIATALEAPSLNLCGKFSVETLAQFIARLDLLVTPDTGPMHIATWTGTPTLNLSLGPVNPWETGPFSPDHHVLQADISCVGCWGCTQEQVYCKQRMIPSRVVATIQGILSHKVMDSHYFCQATRETLLWKTSRKNGLFHLDSIAEMSAQSSINVSVLDAEYRESAWHRYILGQFWQQWFGWQFGHPFMSEQSCREHWQVAATHISELPTLFMQEITKLTTGLITARKQKVCVESFLGEQWQLFAPQLHPFTGYMHMMLQNETNTRQAEKHLLDSVEKLYEVVGKS